MQIKHTLFALFLTLGLAQTSLHADEKSKAGEWQEWFANGKLDGFEVAGGTATYKLENGVLIGTTVEGSPNTFLLSKSYKDFELEFEVNVDNELNSGVQVRSKVRKEGDAPIEGVEKQPAVGRVYGPQCEIAINGSAGDFYDEGRRGKWWPLVLDPEFKRTKEAEGAFKKGEWNKYRIVVTGDHYQSWVNGVKTADFKQSTDPEGGIGFQVHGIKKGTGPYSVRWRAVKFKELN